MQSGTSSVRRALAAALLVLMCAAAPGCVHDGSLTYLEPTQLAPADLATFQLNCKPLAPVWLDQIDGAKLRRPDVAAPYLVRVLPGQRVLLLTTGLNSGPQIHCWFTAIAGHVYRIESQDAQVRITDVATGSYSVIP